MLRCKQHPGVKEFRLLEEQFKGLDFRVLGSRVYIYLALGFRVIA